MKSQLLGAVAAAMFTGPVAHAGELPPWFYERRIIGPNDLEPIEGTIGTPLYAEAKAVARMESSDGTGFCTAWRLGADIVMTNYHCFDFKPCAEVQFHFGYEHSLPLNRQILVKCKEILAKNVTFDYALYRIDPQPLAVPPPPPPLPVPLPLNALFLDAEPPVSQPAPLPVPAQPQPQPLATLADFPAATLWTGPLAIGQRLFVPQHPGATTKEVDRSAACVLRTITPELVEERETITHTCDTDGGSSGSPLMDLKTGYVVALHWGGWYTGEYNLAIPVPLIVDDLAKAVDPAVFAELQIVNH